MGGDHSNRWAVLVYSCKNPAGLAWRARNSLLIFGYEGSPTRIRHNKCAGPLVIPERPTKPLKRGFGCSV
jgi:hypothetical protein